MLFWISPLDREIPLGAGECGVGGLDQDAGSLIKPFAFCRAHSCLHSDPLVCSLREMVLLALFMDGEAGAPTGGLNPHEEEMVYCGSGEASASPRPSSCLVHTRNTVSRCSHLPSRLLCCPDTPGWLGPFPLKAVLGTTCSVFPVSWWPRPFLTQLIFHFKISCLN